MRVPANFGEAAASRRAHSAPRHRAMATAGTPLASCWTRTRSGVRGARRRRELRRPLLRRADQRIAARRDAERSRRSAQIRACHRVWALVVVAPQPTTVRARSTRWISRARSQRRRARPRGLLAVGPAVEPNGATTLTPRMAARFTDSALSDTPNDSTSAVYLNGLRPRPPRRPCRLVAEDPVGRSVRSSSGMPPPRAGPSPRRCARSGTRPPPAAPAGRRGTTATGDGRR